MKKVLALGLLSLFVASGAMAQVDPDPDGIGIYFDTDATVYCVEGVFPGQYGPGFVYLVITNPTIAAGVAGYECYLEVTGPAFVLDWGYQGAAINAATPPDFAVGLASPLVPVNNAVVLLDMTVFLTGVDPVHWRVLPSTNPSIPGARSTPRATIPATCCRCSSRLALRVRSRGFTLPSTTPASAPISWPTRKPRGVV